jgi:uncharacterized SAM-dependent methyltransferase
MSSFATVRVHASQFPEQVGDDLFASLRTRQVNHKFHYDSVKQTQKWLALHQAYSPSRTDPDCAAAYDASFQAVCSRLEPGPAQLIGLGCGGGQKDARLLRLLQDCGRTVSYVPTDVSMAMVLVARRVAVEVIPEQQVFPLVCDLSSAEDLPLDDLSEPNWARVVTFLGMIPNFEPRLILTRLRSLLRPGDLLVFSANLAPGRDYQAGVNQILPLYDNPLTRDWLMTFLLDLGVSSDDGVVRFEVEDDPEGTSLKRVAAYFCFSRTRKLAVQTQEFEFGAGDRVRLFFSYRHTPALLRTLLESYGIEVLAEWITRSEEEGVVLARLSTKPQR